MHPKKEQRAARQILCCSTSSNSTPAGSSPFLSSVLVGCVAWKLLCLTLVEKGVIRVLQRGFFPPCKKPQPGL